MGTNDIPLDKAELLSVLLEGILYGLSLLMQMFGGTIWQLLLSRARRSTRRVNRKMLTTACLLLFFSTVHFVIDIIRFMEGLILYRDTSLGPIAFFEDWSQWTFVSKNFLYAVQSLIGDGVILYRCYVVWQSKLVMILPASLWCAAGVTGFGSPYAASQMSSQDNTDVFGGNTARWIKSFYATAFATNVLTTFLLASRIWYIDQKVAKLHGHSGSQLREMLHIIVDAGAIYFLTLLAALISYIFESNSQFVVLDMIVPIISITFYMVIVRVGLATQANEAMDARSLRYTSAGNGFCANRMQVHITTLTENEVDDGRSSPTSPVGAIGKENRRTRSEITFDDAGEAV